MFLNAENVAIILDSAFSDQFNVDDIITRITKYNDLKIAFKELKSYHKDLCKQINQHINKEYIDCIILSSNIATLDKYIKISPSLDKLKSAIFEEKSYLDKTLMLLNDMMTEKNSVQKLKFHTRSLKHAFIKVEEIKRHLHSCLQNTFLIFLEKEALNFSMIEFYLDKNPSKEYLHQTKTNDSEILKEIENKLGTHLLYFINEKDFPKILKVVHIYSMLGKRKEAETIFRQIYVETLIQKHATEKNILQYGIVKVYDDILNLVSEFCTSIELCMQKQNTEKYPERFADCDFILNIFWMEVLQQIIHALPVYILSPGDAQKFHSDYSATVNFLERFEQCFKKLISIKHIQEHIIYKTFIKKWNLEAYFKIRFIEIAGKFERALLIQHKSTEFNKQRDSPYLLSTSKVLIECLSTCWDDSIFLRPLSHEFWKLTLQLLSRYYVWVFSYVKQKDDEKKSILFYQLAVSIIVDVEQLMKDYETIFNCAITPKIDKLFIESAFLDSVKMLKMIALQVETSIVETLTKQICSHIASVIDIPRLYLKTNRDVPVTCSPYVFAACNSLTDFLSETDSFITKRLKKSVVNRVTISFVEEWANSVQDAIVSVKKMEESLNLLRRMKNKPIMGVKSDDEKIKIQFILDADAIEEFLGSIEVENLEEIKKLKDLINLVDNSF